MIGKLLGHTLVLTTTKHAHLAGDTVKTSDSRIAECIDHHLDTAWHAVPEHLLLPDHLKPPCAGRALALG